MYYLVDSTINLDISYVGYATYYNLWTWKVFKTEENTDAFYKEFSNLALLNIHTLRTKPLCITYTNYLTLLANVHSSF